MIRLPEFVTKEEFDWAIEEAEAKKKTDFSKVEFFTYEEGMCVQCMHFNRKSNSVKQANRLLIPASLFVGITHAANGNKIHRRHRNQLWFIFWQIKFFIFLFIVKHIQKPFWGDSCPVKASCEEKNLEHCGQCKEFPCDLLHQFAYDKQQGDNGKRIEQCKHGIILIFFKITLE